MGRGIDYGLGQTNIDHAMGIRYGVIHQGEVLQAWGDSSEADYGKPSCPKCGAEARDAENNYPDIDGLDYGNQEYECRDCKVSLDSDDVTPEDPDSFNLDDGQYEAYQTQEDPDIFILKSPYYTRAQFCSPCAPGACYLTNPTDEGEKAYCFGHDWFDGGRAPYPVYRVGDDSLVDPE